MTITTGAGGAGQVLQCRNVFLHSNKEEDLARLDFQLLITVTSIGRLNQVMKACHCIDIISSLSLEILTRS